MGRQEVAKLKDAIEARRPIPLERFIYALGIRFVGEVNAKMLARHYGTLRALARRHAAAGRGRRRGEGELDNVDGVGPA